MTPPLVESTTFHELIDKVLPSLETDTRSGGSDDTSTPESEGKIVNIVTGTLDPPLGQDGEITIELMLSYEPSTSMDVKSAAVTLLVDCNRAKRGRRSFMVYYCNRYLYCRESREIVQIKKDMDGYRIFVKDLSPWQYL